MNLHPHAVQWLLLMWYSAATLHRNGTINKSADLVEWLRVNERLAERRISVMMTVEEKAKRIIEDIKLEG